MLIPDPPPTFLYKILSIAPLSPLPAALPLSDLDRKDGYIHLSTSKQVSSTANKYFGTFEELWLLKIKYDVLAEGTDGDGELKSSGEKKIELKWEETERGWFPHFYNGNLGNGNVLEVVRVLKKGTWGESLELEW